LAQASLVGPARARVPVRADRRPSPVSLSRPRALSPSLPPVARWARPVGVVSLRARARPLPLARGRHLLGPVLTSRLRTPVVDAPTSVHFLPPPHSLDPFRARTPLAHFPLLICALSRAPSPSLSHYTRIHAAPPPLTEVRRPFYGRRRARAAPVAFVSSATPSATRDTSRFTPSPSGLPGPWSPESSPCSQSPPPSTRGFTTSPSSPKRS
jgi:hypothetical protein